MPPIVALTASLFCTLVVVVHDRFKNPRTSLALWVPTLWLMILGSRPLSQWMNLSAPIERSVQDQLVDGSPFDRVVYAALMVAGLVILFNRRVSWTEFVRKNPWLTLYFLYCGISVLWSEFPNVAFKRWIKGLGDPIIALVLLTELQPMKAVETAFKRCAYLLVPLSIVFIKYYGDVGRAYDSWTGFTFYTGVTTNKNMLGYLLFVFGSFFVCMLLGKFGWNRDKTRIGAVTPYVLLGMIAWLFSMAESKTPLTCLILGTLLFLGSGIAGVRKHWGSCLLTGVIVFAALEATLGISEALIASVGRDVTLTGRTELWPTLISLSVSPWFGAGFASFWLGDRLNAVWAEWAFKPNQAHNGYLEIYLNLGIVGLLCLLGMIVSSFTHLSRMWVRSSDSVELYLVRRDFARLGMSFLAGYLVYNITEAAIHFLNFLFVIFLIFAIDPPTRGVATDPVRPVGAGATPGTPKGMSKPSLSPAPAKFPSRAPRWPVRSSPLPRPHRVSRTKS